MSIDSLLASEPGAVVKKQAVPGSVDLIGLATQNLVTLRNIQGRARLDSAQQVAMWSALGIQADYSFMTLDLTVENGQFIELTDRAGNVRLFQVVGVPIRYEKGSIPSFSLYPMKQVFMRSPNSP